MGAHVHGWDAARTALTLKCDFLQGSLTFYLQDPRTFLNLHIKNLKEVSCVTLEGGLGGWYFLSQIYPTLSQYDITEKMKK